VSEVRLSAEGRPDICVSAHGWVNKQNSPRVFFEGTGLLPSQTPAGLKDLRQQELDIIKVGLSPDCSGSRQFTKTRLLRKIPARLIELSDRVMQSSTVEGP